MKTVSIIIPVYNEQEFIDELLKRVFASQIPRWKKEIIVVDDGSTDKTKQILRPWIKKITLITKKKNEGKGSAVSLGFLHAHGDVILIQDADLEYNPRDYAALLTPFDSEEINIVYGSRFLGPHMSTKFVYAQGNKFITFITSLLYNTNVTDSETGYKVFRRSVIQDFVFSSQGFNFDQEFTAKVLKRGNRILEVPISYFGRTFKEGKKLTWKDGVVALYTLLKYRLTD